MYNIIVTERALALISSSSLSGVPTVVTMPTRRLASVPGALTHIASKLVLFMGRELILASLA